MAVQKKCILLGDGARGKTSLFVVFSKEFPESYDNPKPEKYVNYYEVDGKKVRDFNVIKTTLKNYK